MFQLQLGSTRRHCVSCAALSWDGSWSEHELRPSQIPEKKPRRHWNMMRCMQCWSTNPYGLLLQLGCLEWSPADLGGIFPSSCRTASLWKHTDTTQASPPPARDNFQWLKENRVLTWDFYLSVSLGCSKMLFRCWVAHQRVYVVPQRGFPTFTVDSGMTNRNLRGWGNQKKKRHSRVNFMMNSCYFNTSLELTRRENLRELYQWVLELLDRKSRF